MKDICRENVEAETEELFLNNLDSTLTDIRSTTAAILSLSSKISPSKLFRKLHQTDLSSARSEIIDILEHQKQELKPEQIISNALKLDKTDAERLLKMAEESKLPLQLEALNIDPAAIESPSIKIILLRYLGQSNQPEVALIIAKFLAESNRTIVIEALKALKNFKVEWLLKPIPIRRRLLVIPVTIPGITLFRPCG